MAQSQSVCLREAAEESVAHVKKSQFYVTVQVRYQHTLEVDRVLAI